MKEPPETFKFAEALFEFRRELFDGQLHVFRNRAGVAGDIFAAFKVRRNKEGAARHDLTGLEPTAAFFERGDEPLERMDRIVEHFRRVACLMSLPSLKSSQRMALRPATVSVLPSTGVP